MAWFVAGFVDDGDIGVGGGGAGLVVVGSGDVCSRVQDCPHGFDIANVAFSYCQELGLDFWADSFGCEGGLEFFGRARQGCAGVFVAQAGGEAVAGAVACGAEEGYCAGCGHVGVVGCWVVEVVWFVLR